MQVTNQIVLLDMNIPGKHNYVFEKRLLGHLLGRALTQLTTLL